MAEWIDLLDLSAERCRERAPRELEESAFERSPRKTWGR
jgi:hypothetical protein